MQVCDIAPTAQAPDGLIALVEVASGAKAVDEPLSKSVTAAREQVVTRVENRVRSRDLNAAPEPAQPKPVLTETQLATVQEGLKKSAAKTVGEPASQLPTIERLRELRERAAANSAPKK